MGHVDRLLAGDICCDLYRQCLALQERSSRTWLAKEDGWMETDGPPKRWRRKRVAAEQGAI
ncbi:hypothetical protein NBRC116598_05550 [Pseudophaeobacter arcticus]|uniref:Uncharacterized protein n=1 Tax=Pseudophaeobacter arcticus TaxID=385492 RepID=A0ABQ0AGV4_9RHOB